MYVSLRKSYQKRRAVILLIVLMMLVLFAVVGITFVLMADTRSTESRIFREHENTFTDSNQGAPPGPTGVSPDPDLQLAYFLNRLIYDDADDQFGVADTMRGWSLARGIYGGQPGNAVAYNGVGRLHNNVQFIDPNSGPTQVDMFTLINQRYFPNANDGLGVRDPEYTNMRANVSNPPSLLVGMNLGTTYPDLNNLFLGSMKSDGTVVVRSFFRDSVFGSLDQSNIHWTDSMGKYLTLRPRPIDMGPGFPYPPDLGGDVKNVDGPGYYDATTKQFYNNDSVWMDINYPIQQNSAGQWYKPLFAPFIVDLDGLADVNVHGNIRNQVNKNQLRAASNHGIASHEVNLEWLLTNSTNPFEVSQLFTGAGGVAGRYGNWGGPSSGQPVPVPVGTTPSNQAGGSNTPHFYANIDADGGENAQTSNPIVTAQAKPVLLPGATGYPTLPSSTVPQLSSFPYFPPNTYLSGYLSNHLEQKNLGVLFNVFTPNGANSAFPVSEMEALLRYGQLNVPSSRVLQLLPNTLTNDVNDPACGKRRHMISTITRDVDRPGITPWLFSSNPANNGDYGLVYSGGGFGGYSGGYLYGPQQASAANFPTMQELQTATQEFGPNDRRARDANLGRVDINRSLPDYPTPDTTTGAIKQADIPQYQAAVQARQQLAKELFDRLCAATMGTTFTPGAPSNPQPGSKQYEAYRWLAQFAVNMVDFVNSDEYSTPFNWDPANKNPSRLTNDTSLDGGFVFGTKLPRVLVNEVYAEFANVPNQKANQAVTQYNVNVWVELHNPMQTDSTYADGQNGAVQFQATNPQSNQPYPVYKLELTQRNQNLWDPSNLRGNRDADPGVGNLQLLTEVTAYTPNANGITGGVVNGACSDSTSIQPASGAFSGKNGSNAGFYVLGPTDPKDTKNQTTLAFPGSATDSRPMPQSTFSTPQLTYKFDASGGNNPTSQPPTILLRRLACPAMPPNDDPTSPTYNPYITMDYIENVPVNDASTFASNGTPQPPSAPSSRYSVGKMEPYASAALVHQDQLQNAYPDRPQQTLFHHNSTVDDPTAAATWPVKIDTLGVDSANRDVFHWLSQVNRTVISPMELTQVSAFKPHLLTQMFVTFAANTSGSPNVYQQPPNGTVFQHTAKWFQPNYRLYRFFEFVEDHDRMAGSVRGGRYPGKVNVNTLRDLETFRALCDAEQPNYFLASGATLSAPVLQGDTTITTSAFNDKGKQTTWKVLPGDPIQLSGETVVVQTATFASNTWTITTVSPIQNPGGYKNGDPAKLDLVGRFYCRLIAARESAFLGANFAVNPLYPALAAKILATDNPAGVSIDPSLNPTNAYPLASTPFQSYAAGNIPAGGPTAQYPNGNGINNTILRMADPSGSGKVQGRLFEIPEAPNYYRFELMNKLHDRITTRSNTFAVWVTVGYFQVTNASTTPGAGQFDPTKQTQNGFNLPPIQLGAEMTDPISGLPTRHKMFAIVDRSALTFLTGQMNKPGPAPVFFYGRSTDQTKLIPTQLEVDSLSGQYEGGPSQGGTTYNIKTGTQIILDEGRDNEEVLSVQGTGTSSSGKPTISIQAKKQHGLVVPFSLGDRRLGNPGPQQAATYNQQTRTWQYFDPRTVGGVVKYYRLVQ